MYKKIFILTILILTIVSCVAEKLNYIVPKKLKGVGYSAHAELTWENRVGFVYEIYRSENGGKEFIKQGESNTDNYLDFFAKQIQKNKPSFIVFCQKVYLSIVKTP